MRNSIVKHFALSTAALLCISMSPLTVHASDSFAGPVNLTEEELQWVNDTYQKGETVQTKDGEFSYKIVRDPHLCGHIIEYTGNGSDIVFPDYTGFVRLNRSSVDLSERDDITSVTYDGVRHPGEMLDDFHNCKNLESLTVNAEYSDQLIELYDLSDDFVKTPSGQCLLNGSFADCTNLKTIVLPHESEKLVCYIGEKVFEGCTALKELDLSGYWGIKEDAFLNCTALEKVVFNENVKEIQDHAFGFIKDAEGNYVRCEGLTIYGVTGTAAETYAKENGIPFVAVTPAAEESVSPELERACTLLKQFAAEQNYNADVRVLAESENVAVVFEQQPAGEKEYDASAITKEIRSFCNENQIDDSKVRVMFLLDAAAENKSEPAAFSGDATCNNVVDVSDAVLAAKFATGDSEAVITDQGKLNADLDGDGSVTLDDVTLILKIITKLL
ncbi:MAG: leucine-rich repeat protein [Oscillospiraceae bacterium]|nr:leucine-rich repeat protein [Oscillospiraceae bacterium]